jgi:hypothetical protein
MLKACPETARLDGFVGGAAAASLREIASLVKAAKRALPAHRSQQILQSLTKLGMPIKQ